MFLPNFGTRPSEVERAKFNQSRQYNTTKGIFQNRVPEVLAIMRKRSMNFKTFYEFMKGNKNAKPENKLPEVKPDLAEFLSTSSNLKSIWFGHSTFLLNMSGKIILVDPVFSASAAPVSFMVKRFQEPVLSLEDLPKIDYILISHDHYDHLDMKVMKFFAQKNVKFITPLGVGSHLIGWGVKSENIVERDWWEGITFDDLTFTATPAQHFSGRDGVHDNETLWASWVIKDANNSVYFSGDSGFDTHFKEIGDKFGPFDVAFLENGQYNELWQEVHVLPEESSQAFLDLQGKRMVPVHWGMFDLSLHSWYEPIEQLEEQAKLKNINLLTPKFGQIVYTKKDNIFEKWWKQFINQ